MQTVNNVITDLNITTSGTERSFDLRKHEQRRVDLYNQTKGSLKGYDCPDCMNRGDFAYLYEDNGYCEMASRPCKCMKIRESLYAIEKSGLSDVMKKFTFDSYTASADWQKYIKTKAESFVEENEGKWFYIGGQVGCGKTHICTAITIALFMQGKSGLYMLWKDKTAELKGLMNTESYDKKIDELKKAEILYIDDFLKTPNKNKPSSSDINLAFEILNYRYINKLTTIISSEWILSEVIAFDEATGSRIKEYTGNYLITISKNGEKNYRLRGQTKV